MTTAGSDRVRAGVLIAVLAAAAFPRAAGADANTAAAEAAFQRAVKLRADGKWAEACEAFKQSLELDAQLGTRFNLAGCYEKIGKLVLAWQLYSELAQRDTNAGRKARAAKLAAQLQPRLSWLRIDAPGKADGFAVTLDGEAATRLLGIETPLDQGAHELVATAPGRAPWRQTVTLREGEHRVIAIQALAAAASEAPAGPEPRSAGEAAPRRDPPAVKRRAEPPRAPASSGRRMFASVTASVGMYSAPPGVSIAPALAVGAGGELGLDVARAGASRIGLGVIANGDVIVDQSTFERFFAGAAVRLASGPIAVHAGPGVSILTGAGDTVLGLGGDVAASLALTPRVGVAVHANLSSVAPPPGGMDNLTVLRLGVGLVYQR